MSNSFAHPESTSDVVELVRANAKVVAIGNGTKPPLTRAIDAAMISTTKLCGVLHYEPREYAFTARAGTRVREVVEMLSERNQYLPFDPVQFCERDSTLGGLIATGISGSKRYRYGGVRDFLVGVEMVTGYGDLVRGGGKVVKNAAGFDIPKLVTSSLGRLGILTELSFKVFPCSVESRTISIYCESHDQALAVIRSAGRQRWDLDAIDYFQNGRIEICVAGPRVATEEIAREIAKEYHGEIRGEEQANQLWQDVCSLSMFSDSESLLRVPLTPQGFEHWMQTAPSLDFHLACGGNALWIGCRDDQVDSVSESLRSLSMTGLVVRGESRSPVVGRPLESEMQRRIQNVFDPDGKFFTRPALARASG